MLERAAYRFGNTVRWLIRFGSAFVVVLIMTPDPPLAVAAMVLAGDRLAYLTQVLGGLLAAIAVRAEILQFRLGTERPAIRFRVRRTQVSIGIPVGFRMDHGPISAGWRAVVVLGGLLVNLAVAGIALALPLPRAIADSLAVLLVANAVEDLMPIRTKGGDVSAGARLLGLRSHGRSAAVLKDLNAFWDNRDNPAHSPDLTNRVLAAYREGDPVARENVHLLAIMLRREGRVAELAELHAESLEQGEKLDEAHLGAFLEFEWNVVAVPGLPQAEADRAAARMERLLEYPQPDKQYSIAGTLALARLRQGRLAEVEPLCTDALASKLEPHMRAVVLATVVLAQRALGQPYRDLLAEAVGISPDDDLVAEAAVPEMVPARER